MKTVLSLIRTRSALLAGVCGLALMQTACAHQVMEPSVVVQTRLGGPVYGTVVAPVYGPPPVVMAPQPVYMAPPPVVVAPWGWGAQSYRPAHPHHHWHGQGLDHGWGRRGW